MLARVCINYTDYMKNSFIVFVALQLLARRDFEMSCLVYSWLISMQKLANYWQDVRKNPYVIMHTDLKKMRQKKNYNSLHSGLMFCFRIVQGCMEIFP